MVSWTHEFDKTRCNDILQKSQNTMKPNVSDDLFFGNCKNLQSAVIFFFSESLYVNFVPVPGDI